MPGFCSWKIWYVDSYKLEILSVICCPVCVRKSAEKWGNSGSFRTMI
ncbi:hypothetical protein SLEP1_g22843 [Rubroshorea leprosula]|uniref:Uncharacterized protein n=1 Tax=Rubroshorea leprosula TaxID=152421 RepID=A0AAV5JAL3_9ROSI|nr:hypothetical protein SLEP1_g22843 [Rubroshorea leprosula]